MIKNSLSLLFRQSSTTSSYKYTSKLCYYSTSTTSSTTSTSNQFKDIESTLRFNNYGIHKPVMVNEVIDRLHLKDGHCYIDATFGLGGHTLNILDRCKGSFVIAVDRDPKIFELTAKIRETYQDRLITLHGNFSNLSQLLKERGLDTLKISGVLMDFGCSSLQLDSPDRGFSFRKDFDGPLDMRMNNTDTSTQRLTATDILNTFSNQQLRDIMYYYGEERHTLKVAHEIIRRRQYERIEKTSQLVDIIESCIPYPAAMKSISRIFRSLRMFVNDETGEIYRGMREAEKILAPGGNLVVISFHSIEDRIAKRFFRNRCAVKRSTLTPLQHDPSFEYVDGSQPLFPTDEEIEWNSRSKPAIVRSATRTSSSPLILDDKEDEYLIYRSNQQ
ncbi:hypothetical protein DFA_01758 [Cavenderia fasciculata]|uniref:S-adenosyl-methyltransferase n=1 Tax=Cavenderia fasciculata TaxID=261658 RepID=F4PUK8_CACFS|nr:uncharacterized protein DFA_01758 [Cavenderia fasciculata]EGG21872.1 hypothetical protein DFA_01758 [Cavenderia fasciculata]|eukprot:XP_004359723.1 hypothetical protein DFA_01758 [Cavenderia fasciculata]